MPENGWSDYQLPITCTLQFYIHLSLINSIHYEHWPYSAVKLNHMAIVCSVAL